MYRLVKFVKNRRFTQFPFEIVYERMAIDKRVVDMKKGEESTDKLRRIQTFKVYAEELEIRLRF